MTLTWKKPQKTFDMKVLRELNPAALDCVNQQPLLPGSDLPPGVPAFFESGEITYSDISFIHIILMEFSGGKTKEGNSGRE